MFQVLLYLQTGASRKYIQPDCGALQLPYQFTQQPKAATDGVPRVAGLYRADVMNELISHNSASG